MNRAISTRVAITGIGIITSIGASLRSFRKNLFAGACGIGPLSVFDTTGFTCHTAGEIRNKELERRLIPREPKRMSRCDRLGLIAADEALADSRLDLQIIDRDRVGVVLGGGAGGMLSWEKYRRGEWLGKTRPRPSLLLPSSPCTLSDVIAARYELTGYRATICTACSSSSTSIGYGADLIRSGKQDIVIAGGSEALSEVTFTGFHSLKLMDPEYCRPFDKNRRGLSLGEGAAIFVMENLERARNRGAPVHGEVLGYAINSDAVHITAPDAAGMARVMNQALKNAGISPWQVDYINAHGTATPINDIMETRAIKKVFSDIQSKKLAVSSTKSQIGHCLGAAGAIEGAATILALQEQIVPPTIHLDEPDPECDLDYVPNTSQEREITVALSNSFAFGGNNTAVVFRKADQ